MRKLTTMEKCGWELPLFPKSCRVGASSVVELACLGCVHLFPSLASVTFSW